jgi:integrase
MEHSAQMDRKMKLSVVIEDYLAKRKKHKSEDTYRIDRQILGNFLRHVGDLQIGNLRPEHVEDYFYGPNGIMNEHPTSQYGRTTNPPVSKGTHNQRRGVLMTFFGSCTRKGLVKVDLMEDVPFLKVPLRPRIFLTPDQLLQLLDLADNPRDRAIIAYALNTGNRAKEIQCLKIKDVDLETGYVYPTITKTHEGKKATPISMDLDRELRRWMITYAQEIGRPLGEEDYLFPARRGGLISHYETREDGTREMVRTPLEWHPDKPMNRLQGVVKYALKELGYDTKGEGIHTIRVAVGRVFYDMAAEEGGDPIRTAMEWFNHSHQQTTERYLRTNVERRRKERLIKGQPFLTKLVDRSNVVPP